VQTDAAAASLRVGNTFRGSDGVRYLVVTGEASCSFNCDMGADANCDNVLGDYCPVELDLSKVRDVGVCLAALTPAPVPAAAPPTAQPSADAGLAHTGSETMLADAGLGFIALGAAASAAATRRRRTLT
jgi:hypothetical protein